MKKREINFKNQINPLGPLNNMQTVHLAVSKTKQPEQKYIVKSIYLGNEYLAFRSMEQAVLKKLYSSNQPIVYKPQSFAFDDQSQSLFIVQQIFPVSLESIILYHKWKKEMINPTLVYDLGYKMYETLNRIKNSGSQFYHKNLKPSNIFYQIKQQEIDWKVTEFGLLTTYPNKYYMNSNKKDTTIKSKSNISFISEQFQNQLYSLAVILIQMITLAPIDDIHNNLKQERTIDSITGMAEAKNSYGKQIIEYIKELLRNRQTIKQAYQEFKQNPPEFTKLPSYRHLQWSFQKFHKLIEDNPYKKVIEQLKKDTEQLKISCDQAMDIAAKYDPQFDFRFTSYRQLELFLSNFKIELDEKQLISVSFMMRYISGMNYMEFLKVCYSPQHIIEGVIKKAIVQYSTRKQFFQTNAGSKQFWKYEEVHKFLNALGVIFKEDQVKEVVREWSGVNKRTAIKYEQFNKIFKDVGQEIPVKSYSKSKKDIEGQKSIKDLLNQLAQKLQEAQNQNLVAFFRGKDTRQKWIVDKNIQKEIKKYLKISQKQFKQNMQQMWEAAGRGDDKNKILVYINLLKIERIYPLPELFKLILTQKINQTGRTQLYRKYQKQEKGWSHDSLIDFNEDEGLQFEKSQLNVIFNQLDKDKSGFLNQKELIFILTGLNEFDKDFLVQKIKQQLKGKWDLFDLFVSNDINKDLCFDAPGDLIDVFQTLHIDIPSEHCKQLYMSGMKGGKFPYLDFLRYFYELPKLFIKASQFWIEQFFNGSFEKFYDLGREKNKKKWNFVSLNKINDELGLNFNYNEMGQVWQKFDPNKQDSLTKQEVARVFHCSYEPDQNILGLDSNQKYRQNETASKMKWQQQRKEQKDSKKQRQNSEKQAKQSLNRNDLAEKVLQKKIGDIALCFVKKSRENGHLTFNEFCACLDEFKIKYIRNVVMKNTTKFQVMDESSNQMKINYVNFLMFVCQQTQEGKQARKVECLIPIMKQLIKYNNISTQEIFKKCRRPPNLMRLTDYEAFLRQLIKTQIYFQDIQDTWKCWGSPDNLTPEQFNKILSSSFESGIQRGKSTKLNKQFSFAQQQNNRYSQQAQSPYFPKKMNTRKSSRDSRPGQISLTPSQYQKNKQKDKQEIKKEAGNLPPRGRRRNSIQQKQKQKQKYEKSQKYEKEVIQKKMTGKLEKQITKASVIQKFEAKIKDKGSQKLNLLFSKTNTVSTQQFANLIQVHYDFEGAECEKLIQSVNSFGKVKMQTIKKYIKKIQSPEKKQKQQPKYQREQNKNERSGKKENLSKKDLSRGKNLKQKEKGQNKGKQIDNEQFRLEDPRKTRINVPLIKQHIKILIGNFTKKYDINQMEPYFFQGNTTINKQDFIKKCLQVNSSISKSMYQKIFMYLKPKAGMISSISFKLSFSFDEQVKLQEAYLPEEIENEIKAIFQKADKDKSGSIQVNQIQYILGSLGLNESQKQIQNYFEKIDKNFDKKISIKEFKIFIEDNILPYLSDFDQDVDSLLAILKMNDVFRTGYLPVPTIGAVLERYGCKINEKQLNTFNRFLANDNGEISIKQFINVLYFPSQPNFPASLKAALYKIRWKRKITFKQVQKIFQNISACFVMSYTSQIVKKKFLTPSTFITPTLNESRFYYNDFYYKNFSKLEQKTGNLINTPNKGDLIVEIKMFDASGIPIPQNQGIKNSILSRSVNIVLYDTSIQEAKDCITNLQVQFDPDTQDLWTFNKNNRSVIVKIGNFQPRKFQKILILYEFIITILDNNKCLDVSCGSVSFPLKQLVIESKVTKRFKINAGLPNKSKDIDKLSISKRKGWRGFIGSGEIESELQIQLIPSTKMQDKLEYISVLPEKSLVNRKAIHLLWTFRQYFALKSADQKRINPDYGNHFIVKTFLMCLDVPDIYEQLIPFWKQKIEPKASSVEIARKIFHHLMIDLHIIIYSRQFQLLPSYPSKNTLANKGLKGGRKKLLEEVFYNIQQWLNDDPKKQYKRRKAYAVDCHPFRVEEKQLNAETRQISDQLSKGK